MRRLTVLPAIVALALLLGACAAGSDDDGGDRATGRATGLAEKTVEAGEVTVKITPKGVDGEGATFAVVLDTHSVELDVDVAAEADLVVGGTAWTDPEWDGAGPSGHHREGTLRFAAAGEATGPVELTIGGLPEPVRVTWTLDP